MATIKVQGTEMAVQRWKVVPIELEASKELDVEQQGMMPKGFLSLTSEEKAATSVQVKRSLADPKAVSMLGQSVVVAEAESRWCHKEQEKRQAPSRAAVVELAAESHIGHDVV